MKYFIDGWDPSYGSSVEDLGEPEGFVSTARVTVDVERSAEDWAPVCVPEGPEPGRVLFVDGVRRIEARVWAGSADGTNADLGVAASWGAGVVCCCDLGAHVLLAEQRRGLFTTAPDAAPLPTRAGEFTRHAVAAADDQAPAQLLNAALQGQLADLELLTTLTARSTDHLHGVEDDLVVVDGPLRGRQHLPRTIGFIKSHRATYLPEELNLQVALLAPGERTPVFLMGTTWERYAWYLRLPGRPGAPWAGVVRIECSAELELPEVTALAGLTQRLLPRFASVEYKDSRAPQNLVPIAGLERDLRHRLGEPTFVLRALQQAAART